MQVTFWPSLTIAPFCQRTSFIKNLVRFSDISVFTWSELLLDAFQEATYVHASARALEFFGDARHLDQFCVLHEPELGQGPGLARRPSTWSNRASEFWRGFAPLTLAEGSYRQGGQKVPHRIKVYFQSFLIVAALLSKSFGTKLLICTNFQTYAMTL